MTTVAQPPLSVVAEDAADDLDRAGRRRSTAVWIGGLSVALAVTMTVAVGLGPVWIAPGTVLEIVGHRVLGAPGALSATTTEANIVWLVRMPRVLLGAVVGAALAVSGVVLQAMVRNVLADPYLLGVTSGASFGAALAILFGVGTGVGAGASALSVSAFAGALGATAAVFALARLGGRVTAIRLVMAGVAVGYLLAAATSFVIFASDSRDGTRAVLFWLLGSLGKARWSELALPALAVAASVAVLYVWGRRLDALALGDDSALTLGVDPARFRAAALVAVALCIGAVVAVAGAIGFVGLVVPHVARRFVGAGHRRVLVVAALLGAIFVVCADVVARVAFAPRELPLGIVTAVVGAPFLLLLVRRFHAAAT
ncbi:MAG: iron ABC transporter permease [Solirubrobacteraceae bacterium]|nr:iron ABC transporter permease [Solirubrobacteraceae bacterium]